MALSHPLRPSFGSQRANLSAVYCGICIASSALQQRQYLLGQLIGLRHHRVAGLLQDLSP